MPSLNLSSPALPTLPGMMPVAASPIAAVDADGGEGFASVIAGLGDGMMLDAPPLPPAGTALPPVRPDFAGPPKPLPILEVEQVMVGSGPLPAHPPSPLPADAITTIYPGQAETAPPPAGAPEKAQQVECDFNPNWTLRSASTLTLIRATPRLAKPLPDPVEPVTMLPRPIASADPAPIDEPGEGLPLLDPTIVPVAEQPVAKLPDVPTDDTAEPKAREPDAPPAVSVPQPEAQHLPAPVIPFAPTSWTAPSVQPAKREGQSPRDGTRVIDSPVPTLSSDKAPGHLPFANPPATRPDLNASVAAAPTASAAASTPNVAPTDGAESPAVTGNAGSGRQAAPTTVPTAPPPGFALPPEMARQVAEMVRAMVEPESPVAAPIIDAAAPASAPVAQAQPSFTLAPSHAAFAALPVVDTGRAEWMQSMIERIAEMPQVDGKREAQIRLLPDALGAIEIKIEQRQDRLHVTVNADSAQARQLLSEAAPRLHDLAEARGLRFAQTDIGGGQSQDRRPAPGQPQVPQRLQPASAAIDAEIQPDGDRIA